MERTQSVAPRPAPVPTPTSKMSKELQEALFWYHNMSNLQSQTDEELRVMLEAINSHIQRLEEEIPSTSDDAARQEKVTDVRELKGFQQAIWEINYQRKHPVPSRKQVSQQVVKAYLLMENFQDTLKAERIEVEANTEDVEERQMHVTTINEIIKDVQRHNNTLLNMVENLHEE